MLVLTSVFDLSLDLAWWSRTLRAAPAGSRFRRGDSEFVDWHPKFFIRQVMP